MTDTKKDFLTVFRDLEAEKLPKDYSCGFDLYSVDYFFAGYNCIC